MIINCCSRALPMSTWPVPVTAVGHFLEGEGLSLIDGGEPIPLSAIIRL